MEDFPLPPPDDPEPPTDWINAVVRAIPAALANNVVFDTGTPPRLIVVKWEHDQLATSFENLQAMLDADGHNLAAVFWGIYRAVQTGLLRAVRGTRHGSLVVSTPRLWEMWRNPTVQYADTLSLLARIINAKSAPSSDKWMELGRALRPPHLKDKLRALDGRCIAGQIADGMLRAGILDRGAVDNDHVQKMLTEIQDRNHWPGVKEQLCILRNEIQRAAELVEPHDKLQHNEPLAPVANDADMIIAHGERCYRIGDSRPYQGSVSEDNVLTAVLAVPAMDETTLKNKSGVPRARDVLRDLQTKYDGVFASAIHRPGSKGQGGYHVRIRLAE